MSPMPSGQAKPTTPLRGRLQDLQAKMQEYLDNGAQLGWLIDPQNQRVEIYRAGQAVEVLEQPATLFGEAVLPGFTLNLKRIWA
ncbi:MAG: Uma2 family endonuclease [Leptolyngbya sp. RL_3_1]|nr:Uma2 family endonuclease [Leptolyngbya sp. RL_3_1]